MAVLPIASCFIVLCIGLCILHALPTGGSTLGFSTELIHRDSPESPFYDPTSTPFSRFHAAIHRSMGRANYLSNVTIFADSIYSDVTKFHGSYLMTLSIGNYKENQPQQIRVVVNTGEGLTWVLCEPCKKCYKHEDPLFRPTVSHKYRKIGCKSSKCTMHKGKCLFKYQSCRYNFNTAGLNISGILSKERLIFFNSNDEKGGLVTVPEFIFGCTHKTGNSDKEPAIGNVGLNGHSLSLIRQLKHKHMIKSSKFSYCLPVNEKKPSRINFGSAANVPDNVPFNVTIHFFIEPVRNKYLLVMTGITAVAPGTKPLNFTMKQENNGRRDHEGYITIDSGMEITFISQVFLFSLVRKLVDLIPNERIAVPDRLAKTLQLCFNWREPMEEKNMPKVFIYFVGKVELVQLEITKPFALVEKNIMCLAIGPSEYVNRLQILGSRAHSGYRTVYDLDAESITFILEDC